MRRYIGELKQVIRRFGLGGVLIVGGRVCFLFLTFVLARTCRPDQFGLFTVALASSQVLAVLATFGTGPAAQTIVVGALTNHDKATAWRFLKFAIVATATGSAVVSLGAICIGLATGRSGESGTAAIATAMLSPVMAASFLREFLARTFEQTVMAFGPRDIGWSLCLTVTVLVLPQVRDHLMWAAVPTLIAVEGIAWCVLWINNIGPLRHGLSSTYRRHPSAERSWINRCFAVMVNYAGSFSFERIDVVLVGLLTSLSEAGVYGVASRFAPLISTGQRFVVPILAPRIARGFALNDTEGMRREVTHGALASLGVALPATLFVWLFTGDILAFFGGRFSDGVWPLRILSLAHLSIAIGSSFGVVTMVGPKPWHYAAAIWVALIPSAILLPIGILTMGVKGAAVITTLGILSYNCILIVLALRALRRTSFSAVQTRS
jgi:O-antigen/teichoic acid export membrane protein